MSMQFYRQVNPYFTHSFLATLEMLKTGLQIPTGDISSHVHLLYCVWEKVDMSWQKLCLRKKKLGDIPISDNLLDVPCAPQLWGQSVQILFCKTTGQLSSGPEEADIVYVSLHGKILNYIISGCSNTFPQQKNVYFE